MEACFKISMSAFIFMIIQITKVQYTNFEHRSVADSSQVSCKIIVNVLMCLRTYLYML